MTHAVTDACIKCKYQDCVVVCPVDCFYEGVNMLVIMPDECIDCGVCIPECPADAIIADNSSEAEKWIEFNAKYAAIWPSITTKAPPPSDAEDWKTVTDKLRYFDPNAADKV